MHLNKWISVIFLVLEMNILQLFVFEILFICFKVVCISSIEELEKLSGEKVTDLHRDNIDHITIPSARPGHPPLKRIPEVFDCWFESGAMPYAQVRPNSDKYAYTDINITLSIMR